MKNSIKSSRLIVGTSLITALILVVGIIVGSIVVAPQVNNPVQAATLPQSVADTDLVAAFEQAMVKVYEDTLPSVVSIRVTKSFTFGNGNGTPLPEDHPEFFNQGGGTGFVWDQEGHIVTNHHVIANATDIEVVFADDTSAQAELIGSDPDSDLAVIKVDLPANALRPIKQGDSDRLQVGQLAIAIGNPFGQEFTMTSGIVSGVGRLIRGGNSGFSIPEVIQTDAPINPGNSGGPLLDRTGAVVGINAQMFSRTGASSGIGFAIPINIAQRVVPTLISGDAYEYAWLGISGGSVTAELTEYRGIPVDTRGALIAEVAEDGPAAQAGLQGQDQSLDEDTDAFRYSGDIITAINGEPINGIEDLITYLVEKVQPGDQAELTVIRTDGTEETVTVTLGTRPSAVELGQTEK